MNKTSLNLLDGQEGVVGDYEKPLDLKMTDQELLLKARKWAETYRSYETGIKTRQERNEAYYKGKQNSGGPGVQDIPIASNLIFEATETFIPMAMAKNPEPVVWADNTAEGKALSNDIKTMLQYHADVLVLRSQLSLMVRHWSIYFLGVMKHGWDESVNDIKSEIILPKNLILDPHGIIDVSGNYEGKYLGEVKKCTAEDLIDLFPEHKAYIVMSVEGLLGTQVQYTEWWTNEYCFYTFKDVVLDKHLNQNFNYSETKEEIDEFGNATKVEIPAQNHFAKPKMPYTFLSVYSTGEHPHDVTNLIEQNIANQNLVNKRIEQIDKNLDHSNNSLAVSAAYFTAETAKQAAQAMQKGNPVLVPAAKGESINGAVQRFPAPGFPNDAFNQLNDMSERLRSIYGTQGLGAPGQEDEKTVRGKIINQNLDSSRIGGGIGDRLEQISDTIFNWWLQLYFVFYDEPHEARILGRGRAVEYATLKASDFDRKIVVSVAPNSMRPKDELTEMNLAVDRWNNKSIDPIEYMKALNVADPIEEAKKLVMWLTNPQQYAMTYFPETQPVMPPGMGTGQEQDIAPSTEGTLSEQPMAPSLAQVPMDAASMGMPQ